MESGDIGRFKRSNKPVHTKPKIRLASRSRTELEQIARDLFKKAIFTDRHVPPDDSRMFQSIFMVFVFSIRTKRYLRQLKQVGMIFEYFDKAGPRSINGYPCFFSAQMLNHQDTKEVWELYHKLQEATEEVFRPSRRV